MISPRNLRARSSGNNPFSHHIRTNASYSRGYLDVGSGLCFFIDGHCWSRGEFRTRYIRDHDVQKRNRFDSCVMHLDVVENTEANYDWKFALTNHSQRLPFRRAKSLVLCTAPHSFGTAICIGIYITHLGVVAFTILTR